MDASWVERVRFLRASRSQKCPTNKSLDAPDRLFALCITGLLGKVVLFSAAVGNERGEFKDDPWV